MIKLSAFGKVDLQVIGNPRIPTTSKAVYSLLSCYADSETCICNLPVKIIAKQLGLSERTILRQLKELKKYKIISRISANKHFDILTKLNPIPFI